jgi:hypothetical protein
MLMLTRGGGMGAPKRVVREQGGVLRARAHRHDGAWRGRNVERLVG